MTKTIRGMGRHETPRTSTCQDCSDPFISPGGLAKKRCVECEHANKLARDRAREARKRAAATQGDTA